MPVDDTLRRGVDAARRPGFLRLGLAGLTIGVHLWLAGSILLPIDRPTGIEYVFVSAPIGALAAGALLA